MEQVVELQTDGIASAWSWASPGWTTLSSSPLSALTLCLYLFIPFLRTSGTVFSFATNTTDNALTIDVKLDGLLFAINGLWTRANILLRPGEWECLCFSYDAGNATWKLYLRGYLESQGVFKESKDRVIPGAIPNVGWLVIGQDQDQLNGGYQADQSFHGRVAKLKIWDKILNPSQVRQVNTCQYPPGTDILKWSLDAWTFNYTVRVINVPSKDICDSSESYWVLLSPGMSFASAIMLCSYISYWLPVPKSLEENEKLLRFIKEIDPGCFRNPNEPIAFLGASDEDFEGLWKNSEGDVINFTNWRSGQPNGGRLENRMGMISLGTWVDFHPRVYRYCAVCEGRSPILLMLKGLCENLPLDRRYVLQGHVNTKPYLRGFSFSHISWDGLQWVAIHPLRSDIVLTHTPFKPYELPLGRKSWSLISNDSGGTAITVMDGCSNEGGLLLTLSPCAEDLYTCDDGSCIQMDRRCDFQADCPDESDEIACAIVTLPGGYKSNVPPRSLDASKAYPVVLHVNILALEIITEKMEIVMDFEVDLSWLDRRLILNDLKNDSIINSLQLDLLKRLWIPEVSFGNAKGNVHTLVDEETKGVILRQGNPQRGGLSRNREVNLFKGSDNPIQLTRKHSATYTCSLNLALYPFDSQECFFNFVLTSASKGILELVGSSEDDGVRYSGSWQLMEYTIDGVSLENGNHSKYSERKILLRFRRRYGFAIFTFFVPSSFFVCIAYLTTYFPVDNIQVRVVIALTAMLVLTTLLSQVSSQLPRNSYFKAIDMWMFSSIGLIFLILIIQTIIDVIHRKDQRHNLTKVSPVQLKRNAFLTCMEKPQEDETSPSQMAPRMLRGMQIGFPIVAGLLIIAYATYLFTSVG